LNTERCSKFLCPLYADSLNSVPGRGPMPSWIMEVGDAPKQQERAKGKPFVGKSGQENDKYLMDIDIDPGVVRINNCIVCRPPDDRDPSGEELVYCHARLLKEIVLTRPQYIITLGKFATQWFLGKEAKMETCHGIPFLWPDDPNIIIIPVYHPSYGLHDGSKMILIQNDFKAVQQTIRGVLKPRDIEDDAGGKYVYKEITSRDELWDKFARPERDNNLVAVDTESILVGDKPNPSVDAAWCLTFSVDGIRGYMVKLDDPVKIDMMNRWLSRPEVLTIFHNAGYDLDVLAYIGIVPARFTCTMTMAYLLQDQPQGLKALAYRLLGVKMTEYSAIVSDAMQITAYDYIVGLTAGEWPLPPKIEHWVGDKRKTKQPQAVEKKLERAQKDFVKSNGTLGLYKRLKSILVEYKKQTGIDIPMPAPASLDDVDPELAKDYACRDAVVTYNVYGILNKRIADEGLEDTLNRDMGMLPMVIDMQHYGIKIRPKHYIELEGYFDERMEDVRKNFVKLYSKLEYALSNNHYSPHVDPTKTFDINLGSTQQVAKALYNLNILPSPTASTEKKQLDIYRAKNPIINLITEFKECQKLRGTYTRPLVLKADVNNRIHTTFRTTNTITGRLSSENPNLQNQPTRSADGKKIREGFIPEEGYSFLSCDYSQIEMRVAAHMSQDPKMLEVFWTGVDIHSQTAAWAYSIDIEDVDPDMQRRPCKSTGFGILYGIGASGLRDQLLSQGVVYSEGECQGFIDMWFGIYPGVKDMMSRFKSDARRYGKVRDLFGRYRVVPEVKSALKWIINRGLREACNSPIQMGASEIIKEAMKQLIPTCRDYGAKIVRPLLQIHDDLVFEVRNDMFDIIAPVVVDIMENAVVLDVPTPVDPKRSMTNWRELEAWSINQFT